MTGSSLEQAWLGYVDQHGLRKPDRGQHVIASAHTCADFFYDDYSLAVFIDGPHHDSDAQKAKDEDINRKLDEQGFIVVRFFKDPAGWTAVFAANADLFGVAKQ